MTKTILTVILSCFALASNAQGQSADYKGAPWVKRVSRPYQLDRGLDGRHLSVWSSHGSYYKADKNAWLWQRPYLYCTTEDLLTQSFVNPFIIPMLEKAGAVVYTPKERDTQTHEVIVDNDTRSTNGLYIESGKWNDCGVGFSLKYGTFNDKTLPFNTGSVRSVSVNHDAEAIWLPEIPADGNYAVYVSYASLPSSIDDAHYIVHHAGSETEFHVNQQMGGGTWVYLGTFYFEAGKNQRNRVVLKSDSHLSDLSPDGTPYAVTADAVRFGGGMSQVERSKPEVTNSVVQKKVKRVVEGKTVEVTVADTVKTYKYGKGIKSGHPRFLEAARYNIQFSGLTDSLFNEYHSVNDYNDDLRARSHMINTLAGSSCYLPDTVGLGVPLELQFALHTDAGYRANDDLVGTLTIATGYDDYGCTTYRSGLTRKAATNLADHMLKGVSSDLSKLYNVEWPKRELRIQNYAETRMPLVPSTILELLSHQNYRDMTLAHDPNFKFMASRAIYKVLLREVYANHDLGEPVIAPLPVTAMSATLAPKQNYADEGPHAMVSVVVSWQPTLDPLEPSSKPTNYVLYMRRGNDDWDEGTLTDGQCKVQVNIKPGAHYQFRVAALNDGGESFPSSTVSFYAVEAKAREGADVESGSKYRSSKNSPTLLLVDGFDRVSGPARVFTNTKEGFDLNRDIGVAYGDNFSLAGRQTVFSREQGGKEGSAALGFCTNELVGKCIAGNHFDNVVLHARDILTVSQDYNIVSMSRAAFDQLSADDIERYAAIDFVGGLQADKSYNLKHYDLFTTQTRKLLAEYAKKGGRLFVSGAFLGEPAASQPAKAKKSVAENDSVFMAQVLHCDYRATINHRDRATFSGLGINIPVFNVPSATHYAVQESTVLEAVGKEAFPAFAYADAKASNGYSAGVAWPKGVVMGFPYECITDPNIRQQVMRGILLHLFPK